MFTIKPISDKDNIDYSPYYDPQNIEHTDLYLPEYWEGVHIGKIQDIKENVKCRLKKENYGHGYSLVSFTDGTYKERNALVKREFVDNCIKNPNSYVQFKLDRKDLLIPPAEKRKNYKKLSIILVAIIIILILLIVVYLVLKEYKILDNKKNLLNNNIANTDSFTFSLK